MRRPARPEVIFNFGACALSFPISSQPEEEQLKSSLGLVLARTIADTRVRSGQYMRYTYPVELPIPLLTRDEFLVSRDQSAFCTVHALTRLVTRSESAILHRVGFRRIFLANSHRYIHFRLFQAVVLELSGGRTLRNRRLHLLRDMGTSYMRS